MRLRRPQDAHTIEKQCPNASCSQHHITQDLTAFEEYGRLFLREDDDIYCRECGTEMIDV
ncbi:MAG TPA: hypothetical protein VGL78_04235 [Solirubrobacteraceae bacterium]|jgi:hypothetical protein